MTREEARQEINKVAKSTLPDGMKRSAIRSIYEELDSVSPTQKKSRWIEVDTNRYTCGNCSHCFTIVPEDNQIWQFKYCPNCGSLMEVAR